MEYASNGKANAALTTGIIGTAGFGAQLLGNLLGGWGMAPAAMCSENTPVTRYTLDQQNTISEKNMEIAYWRGQDETNRKISDAYTKLENRILGLSGEVRANKEEQAALNLQQAVYNGTNTAAVGCIQGQIAQLQSLTKLIVPNSSCCPGWGEVTVKPATTTTTT